MSHRIVHTLAAITMAGTIAIAGAGAAFAAPHAPRLGTHRQQGQALQNIAQVEGVTPQVLLQDLQQGQTLLQIANGKYSSAGDLATALLATAKSRLDAAATSGTITPTQENLIYTMLLARTTTLVTTPHPLQTLIQSDGQKIHSAVTQTLNAVATACDTTPSALTTTLRAGGSTVLAVCQKTNPQETQAALTAVIYAPIQARLHAAEGKGLITAAQEATLDARVQTAITKAITTTLPARPNTNG